jgi:hypothetical protein
MRFAAAVAATALWLVAAMPAAAADTLTPTPVTTTLVAGTSTTLNKTHNLDGLPARADIIVAIDTTSSMTAPIAQAQADANSICTTVQGQIPGARFAVVALGDYPAMPSGSPSDDPYALLTPGFVSSCAAFSAAIATMTARYGGTARVRWSASIAKVQSGNFRRPDEVRTLEHGRIELVLRTLARIGRR